MYQALIGHGWNSAWFKCAYDANKIILLSIGTCGML